MVDVTDQLIIENLKRAGDMIREAAQMTVPKAGTPEEAVATVTALMFRAIIPKEAALEFKRLGGTSVEKFRDALLRSLHDPT